MPSGEDKLMAVSQQLDEIMSGKVGEIRCPYCGRVTPEGEMFCCLKMVLALTALADARDKFRPSVRN